MMMYGAGGDEVFLKRRRMIEIQAFQLVLQNGKDNILQRYNDFLKTQDNTYSSRRNIDTPEGWRTLQQQYPQISTETDTEISSLYHDLNISYEVMKLPLETRLEHTADIGLQKNILKKHWNFDFQTPFKEQAVFNTYKAIKPYYKNSIAHVLKDNLRELLDNEGWPMPGNSV